MRQGWACEGSAGSSHRGGIVAIEDAVFVGVDVSKQRLDVCLRPGGPPWSVAHTEAGIAGLLERLAGYRVELVVIEATGGMEIAVTAALALAIASRRGQSTAGARLREGNGQAGQDRCAPRPRAGALPPGCPP